MTHHIELRPAALRALKRIDRQNRARIRGAIALLAHDPRPPGYRHLRGRTGYRVRVGEYRIIYTVDDGRLIVIVVHVGHRSSVYKGK